MELLLRGLKELSDLTGCVSINYFNFFKKEYHVNVKSDTKQKNSA